MSLRPSLLSRWIVTLVGFGAVAPVQAQLAAKSPFMAPQAAANNAPTAGAPLQFIGYIAMGDGVQYRLFDPSKKTYTWLKLNQRDADFDVLAKQHDEAQKTLTIEYQGRTLTLAMREPKVVSSGSAGNAMPPPPMPMPASNVAPAVTQAVVLNPTPADEQRRLEAVASEVARRRALREQATQQMSQGAPPPPQPAMQPPMQPQTQPPIPRGPSGSTRPAGPNNQQR